MKLRFRYSISTFLIILTLLCIWMGKISIDARRQKAAVEWVKRTGGGVLYDWNDSDQKYWEPPRLHPPYPKWLRDLFGDDYFQTATYAWISEGSQIDDLSLVTNLPAIQTLVIDECGIEDISPVARLTHLQSLDIARNRIKDLTPLANLSSLTELYASDNQITDITPLFKLKLEIAELDGNPINKEELERLNREVAERYRQ